MAKETDKKQTSRVKINKKAWVRIVAPASFGQQEIGETYVESTETMIGRKVNVNLRELTGNVKDQSAYASFRMVKAEGNTLHTEPVGYSLTPSYVKRLVRKCTSRLDDYFEFTTKAGEKVVAKTIMVTRSKVQRSVQKALRVKLKEVLQQELRGTDFTSFVSMLVSGKIRKLLTSLNKITPLRECAIRVLQLKGMSSEPLPEEVISEVVEDVEAEAEAVNADADVDTGEETA